MAIMTQGFLLSGENMKRMARLVQQGSHIAIQTNRIHENERETSLGERGLIAAWGFPLAALQIQQFQITHSLYETSELRINFTGDVQAALNQVPDLGERPQCRTALGVHTQVPRTKSVNLQVLGSSFLNPADQRHNRGFDAFVKPKAVLRRVVKTLQMLKRIIPVTRKSGVGRNLRSYFQELVENFFERFLLRQP